jgi:hypothetical protein
MTAINCDDLDLNNLSPLGFIFKLKELPNTEIHVQGASFPGMTLGVASVGTGFVRIPTPGNISYDTFSITFKVSENLKSYTDIFDWMVSLGHPDRLNGQYENIKSDASLVILNSSKRSQVNVRFTDCFPTYISPINFDTTLTDVEYVTCTANFAFLRMYFEDI